MADDFRYVSPGDKVRGNITSGGWNGAMDAARDFRARSEGNARDVSNDLASGVPLRVRNNTGSDLPVYSVVRLGAAIFTPTNNVNAFQFTPLLSGLVPADDLPFAVLQQPVETDLIGVALAVGYTPVKLDVSADADTGGWKKASVLAGNLDKLELKEDGEVTVIWRETGTGTKWALVLLGLGGSVGGCLPNLIDPTTLPGYTAGVIQFLVHDPDFPDDCFRWLTPGLCPDEAP